MLNKVAQSTFLTRNRSGGQGLRALNAKQVTPGDEGSHLPGRSLGMPVVQVGAVDTESRGEPGPGLQSRCRDATLLRIADASWRW